MNFYKHHLGDYDGATVHLSWDEDMAYTRLIRVYYRLEKPIPLAPADAFRLVRASSKAQREAVTRVLHEFFEEHEDGWHNKRCDEEIATYQAQAETNRRIARARTVERSADEPSHDSSHASSTKRAPSHKPVARTKSQQPLATATDSPESSAEKSVPGAQKRAPDTGPAWEAYRAAYRGRYGQEPTPNAEDNAHMLAFVKKVPAEDAPGIAAFYVGHNKAWYVGKQHAVKWLREDAVGLRTQWLNRRPMTETLARHADRTGTTASVFGELLQEAKEAH